MTQVAFYVVCCISSNHSSGVNRYERFQKSGDVHAGSRLNCVFFSWINIFNLRWPRQIFMQRMVKWLWVNRWFQLMNHRLLLSQCDWFLRVPHKKLIWSRRREKLSYRQKIACSFAWLLIGRSNYNFWFQCWRECIWSAWSRYSRRSCCPGSWSLSLMGSVAVGEQSPIFDWHFINREHLFLSLK